MTLTDTHKTIMAAAGLLALGATGVTLFQTQSAAAEDKKEIKQEIKKTANEVRVEMLLARVKALNEKKDEKKLTASEETELELNLDQIKAIKAEQVKEAK